MEIKFTRKPLECMRPLYNQVQTQEQTHEIRLPDAYPDIGKVLCCWAKVLIRGKEWRSSSMGANGGTMIWILYAPEDGTQPRVLDAWVPFQWRWDLRESCDDGVIFLCPVLTDLDCRGISARKIMVRAVVSNCAQAMIKEKINMATMPDLPDDVQILTKSYPMELPVEAGEKQITLEERLAVPDMDLTARVISYDLIPAITEQKVVGNRLVFRGNAKLSVMYMTEDAEIKKWETEIPFSQYKDLDKEYEATASAWVMPVVTALELEEDENGELILRAGISAQYLVYERILIDVVQDAYSPLRQMEIEYEDLMPPALLDQFTCEMSSETDIDADETQILSCAHFQDYPTLGNDVTMDGRFHLLYRNNEGQMSSGTTYCQWHGNIFYDEGNQVCLWPGIPSEPAVSPGVDYVHIESRYPVWVQMYSGHKIPMVTELKLGECKEPDDHRPSIVLRRAGEEGLWQLAKEYGSTVELIKEANQITQEPIVGQMLLIPVM